MRPVEEPYVLIGQIRSVIYFLYYPTHCFLERGWDILISYIQFRFSSADEDRDSVANERDYNGGVELT